MVVKTNIKDGLILVFFWGAFLALEWWSWKYWEVNKVYFIAPFVILFLLLFRFSVALRFFTFPFMAAILFKLSESELAPILSTHTSQGLTMGWVVLGALMVGFLVNELPWLFLTFSDSESGEEIAGAIIIGSIIGGIIGFIIKAVLKYLEMHLGRIDISLMSIVNEGLRGAFIGTVFGVGFIVTILIIIAVISLIFKLKFVILLLIILAFSGEKIGKTGKEIAIAIRELGLFVKDSSLILFYHAKKNIIDFFNIAFDKKTIILMGNPSYYYIWIGIFTFLVSLWIIFIFNDKKKYPLYLSIIIAGIITPIYKVLLSIILLPSKPWMILALSFAFFTISPIFLIFLTEFFYKKSEKIYNYFLRASKIERTKFKWVVSYPYLVCREHLSRAKRKRIGLFYYDVRCRITTCDNNNLITNIKEIVGIIGNDFKNLKIENKKLYISLWDVKSKKARNADIDLLKIVESKDMPHPMLYDFAIDAVYNTLLNDLTRARNYVKKISVEINGNPPLSEHAWRMIKYEFGKVKIKRQ